MRTEGSKMRKLARHVVRPEHWPELNKKTKEFIASDEYTRSLWDMIRHNAEVATNWYDAAENGDEDIAKWVPQGGGGDCYTVYPGDAAASRCDGLYDALMLYVKTSKRQGSGDVWCELSTEHDLFFWIDASEVS
jgi:hypothetical protein